MQGNLVNMSFYPSVVKDVKKGQEFVLILEDAFCSASNFLFAFFIYLSSSVFSYKVHGGWYLFARCTDIDIDIDIDIIKEYHGESPD